MDQIGLNRISHLSKNVTIKFTLTPRINSDFFFKSVQNGPNRTNMGKKWNFSPEAQAVAETVAVVVSA